MTAQELYEELKSAFDYLGPGFTGMGEVQVYVDRAGLRLYFESRGCIIPIPPAGNKDKTRGSK